jgi:REP element-mobilizing transposase RayT
MVCPTKYRRAVIDAEVDATLKSICFEIGSRYEIVFVEIGSDLDHVHFLIQSVPTMSPSRLAQIVKSITAREIFRRCPQVKKQLWGGAFWSSSFYINTVGHQGNEESVAAYVANQGRSSEYKRIHTEPLRVNQLELF